MCGPGSKEDSALGKLFFHKLQNSGQTLTLAFSFFFLRFYVLRERGCPEFVFLDTRLNHETLCKYRPLHCQFEKHGCTAVFSVKVATFLGGEGVKAYSSVLFTMMVE